MGNATDLFMSQAKSESFWTSIFCLFLLHLSTKKEDIDTLGVWICEESGHPKWFMKKKDYVFNINKLAFADIAIESPIHEGLFREMHKKLPQNCSGIKPDLFITCKLDNPHKYDYIIIENKISNQDFTWPQKNGYPELVKYLNECGMTCYFILLISVGNDFSFNGAKDLQHKMIEEGLEKYFGVLLWEDVIRKMHKNRFLLPGININDWQKNTDALDEDAEV